tara:strand:+ start:1876 stop:2142 length:267 start_codon:yes stop_codon:yes gene_type:complete
MINSILLIAVFASTILGIIVLLVHMNFFTFKKASSIKALYSALIIGLLLVVITFSVKLISTDGGKKWLDSFSSSSDCEKSDRPYWCEL